MTLQLTLAARYLWGRKLRTFLTTLAIVFGVLVIFAMNLLVPTMLQAFQANVLAASGQVDLTVTQKAGEAFNPTVLSKVRAAPGIRAVAGSLSRTINIPEGFFGRGVKLDAVSLVGIDPRAAPQLRDYPMQEGRFLRPVDEKAAVVTSSLAEQVGLKVGDTLRLPTTVGVVKLTVVGLRPPRAAPGNEEVLVTLAEAQRLLDLANRINTIEANFDTADTAQRQAIETDVAARLGKDYELGSLSGGSELVGSIQMAGIIFNALGVMALFMGGFIIFNTFRTVVAERRHDIGMLRAVGASRRTIAGLFLAEGLLQGVVGTGIGMLLGYLMGSGMVLLYAGFMQQFLHLQMGAPVVEPSLVVTAIVLGVGATLLAGLLPALAASRLTPLEAIRQASLEVEKPSIGRGTIVGLVLAGLAALALFTGNVGAVMAGGLAFLVGLVLVAPLLVKPIVDVFGTLTSRLLASDGTGSLAEGNLTRQPSRAAITASATMIGLAIIVAAMGLLTSMTGGVIDLTRKTLGSDYLLMPPSVAVWGSNVGASSDLSARLRSTSGVGLVSTLRFAASSLSGTVGKGGAAKESGVSLLGIDPVVYPQISSLNFAQGEPGQAYADLASPRTLIVNGILASQAGLKLGDEVRLSTPEGEKAYRIVGVASDMLNAKVMTAYIAQANLATDFRKTEDVFFQLNLAPGANRAEVETRLKTIVADYPQFKLTSGQAYVDEMAQTLDSVYTLLYFMLAALALPSLIAILNTLAIGVIERTREIGMLRAIGATRDQVRRTILVEALLLAAVGTAFGLLGGLYLGYVMVVGLNATGIFPVAYSFPLAGVLVAIAVGLLFGVLAALLPARQAARLEIVQALHYE